MTKHDHGLKEKVEGAIDKVKGEVKEVVGKVTDNKKLQAEGKWDKVKGTAKDTVGNVKEKYMNIKSIKKTNKKEPSMYGRASSKLLDLRRLSATQK